MSVRSPQPHQCRTCYTPLVELLSDAAGRLFGCPRCRSVDARNALPPAAEVTVRTLSRNERRRTARRWRKGCCGARSVPKHVESTRPYPTRVAVLRSEMFDRLGSKTRDIGDGWAMGVLDSGGGAMALLTRRLPMIAPRFDPAAEYAAEVQTEVVELIPIRGPAHGVADKAAPLPLVLQAFDRLAAGRIDAAGRGWMR